MKRDGGLKHFGYAFLFAVVIYAAAYAWIEHRRTRRGPWVVTFTNVEGNPAFLVSQGALGLTNVQFRFLGQAPYTNRLIKVPFDQPRPVPFEVGFAKCVFMDTTFLPGTVTFQAYGHEIELLPRVIILDHEEHAWSSGERIQLKPAPERTNAAAKLR